MDRLWQKLTGGAASHPAAVHSLGRDISVPLAAMGAARFTFAALCESPLGARDYLRLAHAYDTLMNQPKHQIDARTVLHIASSLDTIVKFP